MALGDVGGIAHREREIEHEGALAAGSEGNGARGRAHPAAGAEQRDVALVLGRASRERRVEASGRRERVPQRRAHRGAAR